MLTIFRLLFICLILLPQSIEARSLFWQDINVNATLDADGRLQIREQQTIVFSGAWNGGERTFRIRPGQKMKFGSISRIDDKGQEIPLIRGNLKLVDHWDHNGKKTIRWRSRLPSSPPFNNTPITYVLRYSLGHILTPDGQGYLLNHDFCFPDRSGIVKNFRLNLEFDPLWQHPPVSLTRNNIAPGNGVVFRQVLSFSGQSQPAIRKKQAPLPVAALPTPVSPAPNWLRILLLLVLISWIIWKIHSFFQWENALNRFERILPASIVDEQWLEKELFIYKPEVAGATWDKTTSTAEVSAVLARLVQEGKMKSWLTPYLIPFFNIKFPGIPPVLHLQLLQPKKSFSGYEYTLINGLFVDGSDQTDTQTIRKYYQKRRKTFDPVLKLRSPMKRQIKKLVKEGHSALDMIWVPTVVFAVAGFFLLLTNGFLHKSEFIPLQAPGMFGIVQFWVIGFAMAFNYRKSVLSLGWRLFAVFFFICCVLIGFCVFLFFPVSSILLLGLFCMAMAITNNIVNLSKSRDSEEGLTLRRKFATARNYFKQELTQENPQINDSWFPYLLAFGLGSKVDSWFQKFGTNVSHFGSTGMSSHTGSSHSGSSFSGGGGTFGGGGTSGSWSAAVGSLTASGGGSSSGGSGGGGSSGGGGGGGW